MKRQFAVIGLGKFGSAVAETLAQSGKEVLAIDSDGSRVKAVADLVTIALELDAADEKALREAGVQNVDVAVVSIGEDIESSILVVMLLKELEVGEIIAKAVNDLHGKILRHIGVDRVVYPERDMAQRVAQSLIRPAFLEQIELSPEYSIVELPAPAFLWNKTIREGNLRAEYGISIIAIKRQFFVEGTKKVKWNINPAPDDLIQKEDVLVVLGANSDIEKLG
jgi:trk system potassium uptake protein TrkA